MDRISVYRTRTTNLPILNDFAELYTKVLCHVLSNINTERNLLKSTTLDKFKIPSRWYNTVKVDVDARILSVKETLKLNKEQKEDSIKELEKYIKEQVVKRNNLLKKKKKTSKDEENLKKLNTLIFKKKHRLDVLKAKLLRIEKQLSYDVPSMCLGSKALFKKQHYISNKKYKTIAEWQEKDYIGWQEFHEIWKKEWHFARTNQFYIIGSKDENNGNVCCTPEIQDDGNISLRILIPESLRTDSKYFYITDLYFKHGHKQICDAINAYDDKNGKAISFRFIKDSKNWQIFVTIHEEIPEISIKDGGYIGIDLNVGFLAGAVVLKNGNLLNRENGIFRIDMDVFRKTSDQSTAIIGDAVKELIEKAKLYNLPICIEDLDFTKKKNTLREKTTKKARYKLSSFAYKKFYAILVSACVKNGIELKKVNPAFTSLIGRNKFMKMYGISVHHAAAICIARRGMDMREELNNNEFLNDSGFLVICSLPERMTNKHHWKYLSAVLSILKKTLKEFGYNRVRKKEISFLTDDSRRRAGIALASLEWKLASSVGCGDSALGQN